MYPVLIAIFCTCIFCNVLSIPEILIRAQCQAKCLEKYGDRYTKTTRAGIALSPYLCLDDCKDCWSACEIPLPNLDLCFDLCRRIKNQTTCRSGCQFQFGLKDKLTEPDESGLRQSLSVVNSVKLLCMNLQGNVEAPSVLATFFIELNETTIRPQVYIVYIRQKVRTIGDARIDGVDKYRISDWYPLGTRTEQSFSLQKLLTGIEYQLKARVVYADQVTEENADNKWFRTLSGDNVLNPPSSISVVRQFTEGGKLLAEVSWVPDLFYPTCFYHLIWRDDHTTEYRTFPIEERFGYILDKLNYSTDYSILIRSLSGLKFPRLESSTVSTSFRTWACLEANRFDFQICEPGPVINLSARVNNETATVTWEKPLYVTVSNEIDHYSVRWRSLPHLGRCFNNIEKKFSLLSNESSLTLDPLGRNCYYLFEISAVSSGGKSPISSVTFNYTVPDINGNETNQMRVIFQTEYFILIPVTVGIVIIGVLVIIKFKPKADPKLKMAPTVDRTWLRVRL